mmetsp:Transcript_22892/g.50866  ORF Transcript_22892/g.50866 Transcript_22892/m.50866 type:complete len:161 (+) Transcript_22892:322-804(+)
MDGGKRTVHNTIEGKKVATRTMLYLFVDVQKIGCVLVPVFVAVVRQQRSLYNTNNTNNHYNSPSKLIVIMCNCKQRRSLRIDVFCRVLCSNGVASIQSVGCAIVLLAAPADQKREHTKLQKPPFALWKLFSVRSYFKHARTPFCVFIEKNVRGTACCCVP